MFGGRRRHLPPIKLCSTFIRTAALKPTSLELGGTTAIDGELDASDEAGFVTRKEQYTVGYLHRLDEPAHRAAGDNGVNCFSREFKIQQRCVGAPRVDRVHADAVADMRDCGTLRHMTDRGLDRLVRERDGGCTDSPNRGQIYDRAGVLLDHMRNHFPHS